MRHLRHIVLAATVVGLSLTFAAPLASAQDSRRSGARHARHDGHVPSHVMVSAVRR